MRAAPLDKQASRSAKQPPASAKQPPASEKLQKVISRAGIASRREAETWIGEGRFRVNGKVAVVGDRVTDRDVIELDGKRLHARKQDHMRRRVIVYNKPEGEICSRKDPEGRKSVFDTLPKLKGERWIVVGRLDFNTAGLLLFSNDGELANRLMHPSSEIDREYMVRVMGEVDDEMLQRLRDGVMLEDGEASFSDIVELKKKDDGSINRWFICCLMEGRNREVRRLWESQGVTVSRLKRVRFGPVILPSRVKRGQWQELDENDVSILSKSVGMSMPC